jgi:uncharacterized protein YeaO (DUF488 family)
MSLAVKRAYEKAGPRDGCRVLVDGLWPRGVSKEQLQVEQWLRALAPSAKLRSWYGHDPARWERFRGRYRQELEQAPRRALVEELVRRARRGKVTLVFAARDAARSNAAVLAELIEESL